VTHEELLGEQFEAHREHLRAVAYRMLGSRGEADDAVQEAWIRLSRSDPSAIDNLGGWLTTVVARMSLDMLRARASRREEPRSDQLPDLARAVGDDPESDALLAASVGAALLVVLEALTPAERLAFVLHDTFGVPFNEIGPIVGRSSDAAKMLASRARQKVRGVDSTAEADPVRQRAVVEAFLAAARRGDFDALLAVLDPDVVQRADAAAVRMAARKGVPEEVRGAQRVAEIFSGSAQVAKPALIDGAVGLVWAVDGRPKVAWDFTIRNGKVILIEMLGDRETLNRLELMLLDG
jgi:RNA polymerase sigma-70 factor (ECF subfamily)